MNDIKKYTQSEVYLIKKELNLESCPESTFDRFLYQAKVSGLNPLLGQCTLVPRKKKVCKNDKWSWITNWQFIAQKDGLLKRAQEFPDWNGKESGYILESDNFKCDLGSAKIIHEFGVEHFDPKVRPIGAWARVHRKNMPPVLRIISFKEFAPANLLSDPNKNPMWVRMPGNMIEKCATSAALREAYPDKFSGIYDEAEFHDESKNSKKQTKALAKNNDAKETDLVEETDLDEIFNGEKLPDDLPKEEKKDEIDNVEFDVLKSEARRLIIECAGKNQISNDEVFKMASKNEKVNFGMIEKMKTKDQYDKLKEVVNELKSGGG